MLLCHAELIDYEVDEYPMVYALCSETLTRGVALSDDEEIQKQSRLVERLMERTKLCRERS